jgi:hypothetical protein
MNLNQYHKANRTKGGNKMKNTYDNGPIPVEQILTNPRYNRMLENIFDISLLERIDSKVRLHPALGNPKSSAAACINVLGYLSKHPQELLKFLNSFDLDVDEVVKFPTGSELGGDVHNDQGYVVFEWIGPGKSPINEGVGGGRGWNRTSIDAFILARISGRLTQLLIEWKFTESYEDEKKRPEQLQRFAGIRGNERMRRYSSVLAILRRRKKLPFSFENDVGFSLSDFGYEPFYQLLRQTLLGIMTDDCQLSDSLKIEDHRILHLSHSKNEDLDILKPIHLSKCPGIVDKVGMQFHEAWSELLSIHERERFVSGYWDTRIETFEDADLKEFLRERY